MKRNPCARRVFAGLLSLVMLVCLLAAPALADEETSASAVTEQASAAKVAAPTKEEAPAKEDVSTKEEAPAKEDASAKEQTSVKEDASAKEQTSVKEDASAKDEAPIKEDASAKDEAPVKEDASVKEQAPVEKDASAKEQTSVKEDASAKDEAPAEEESSAADKVEVKTPIATPDATTLEPVQESPSAAPRPTRAPSAVTATQTPVLDESETAPSAAETPAVFSIRGDEADEVDDGFTVDWDEVGLMDGGDWRVSKWGIARGEDGYWVYLENSQPQAYVDITYYNNAGDTIGYQAWTAQGQRLLNGNNSPIPGAALTVMTEGGGVRMEGFVPDNFFKGSRFILSSGAVTLESEDIYLLNGVPAPTSEEDPASKEPTVADPNASYQGITIDGDFSDWDAVPRYPIQDIDASGVVKNYDTVDQVSVMWDGDTVYLLLVAEGDRDWQGNLTGCGNWNSVCNAGPHGNGKYAIKTDLGGELLIQPTAEGNVPAVAGINNAQVAVNSKAWNGAPYMWEIAIPADKLPPYLASFDFGLYMSEPTIANITNFHSAEDDKEFNGIVYDGNIEDWTYYPSYRIEYATPGTQDIVRDAQGALWSNNNILYGYASSNMLAHLDDEGGCFLGGISLAFNGDREYKAHPTDGGFYPRLFSFESGQAVEVNAGTHLTPGDHIFYIFDARTNPAAPTYNAETNRTFYPDDAYLMDHAFGQMTVHVDGVRDYAEFELDLDRVAQYIGKDADTAFKVIEIQWGRLGQQWISYAGTPTGPIISVVLLLGAVCVPMGYVELKKRRQAKAGKAQ